MVYSVVGILHFIDNAMTTRSYVDVFNHNLKKCMQIRARRDICLSAGQ